MKKLMGGAALALLVAMFAATALATNTPPPGGGHDPVSICHKPGTPAQQTLTVDDDSVELTGHLGHGDTMGPCQELPPVDYCDTLEGVQAEDEDCPPPPVDECDTEPGVQTEPCEEQPPVTPPPGHKCTFVGADKDGGHDKYGGTNDDCAPFPDPPTPAAVTPKPDAPPVPPAVTPTPDAPVVTPTPPASKPKPKVTPKPDRPVDNTVVRVKKKKNGVVVITTKDGRKHVGQMGLG